MAIHVVIFLFKTSYAAYIKFPLHSYCTILAMFNLVRLLNNWFIIRFVLCGHVWHVIRYEIEHSITCIDLLTVFTEITKLCVSYVYNIGNIWLNENCENKVRIPYCFGISFKAFLVKKNRPNDCLLVNITLTYFFL